MRYSVLRWRNICAADPTRRGKYFDRLFWLEFVFIHGILARLRTGRARVDCFQRSTTHHTSSGDTIQMPPVVWGEGVYWGLSDLQALRLDQRRAWDFHAALEGFAQNSLVRLD